MWVVWILIPSFLSGFWSLRFSPAHTRICDKVVLKHEQVSSRHDESPVVQGWAEIKLDFGSGPIATNTTSVYFTSEANSFGAVMDRWFDGRVQQVKISKGIRKILHVTQGHKNLRLNLAGFFRNVTQYFPADGDERSRGNEGSTESAQKGPFDGEGQQGGSSRKWLRPNTTDVTRLLVVSCGWPRCLWKRRAFVVSAQLGPMASRPWTLCWADQASPLLAKDVEEALAEKGRALIPAIQKARQIQT